MIANDQQVIQEFKEDYVQYFLKKFVDLQRTRHEPNNANLKTFAECLNELGIVNEDVDQSIAQILTSRMADHLKYVITVIEHLSDKAKKLVVENLINELKQKKTDIRVLSFNELGIVITHILQHKDYEVTPLLRYLDKLINEDLKDEFEINIMADLFYNLVKFGYINPKKLPNFHYHFLNDLCNKHTELSKSKLINVLWAMAYTEEEDLQNPLIPLFIEKLPSMELSKSLSDEELAQLYQLVLFVETKIRDGLYPSDYRLSLK